MGEVRKIGDEYYIEFFARGLLYQQKAGSDAAVAARMLEEVEGKIRQGEMGTVTRDVEIDIFIKTFLESAQQEHSSKTYQRFISTLKHFQKFLQEKYPALDRLSGVTPDVLEEYRLYIIRQAKLRTPNVKPQVLNLTLMLLETFLDHAIKLGYLNDHPMIHLKWVPDSLEKKYLFFDENKMSSVLAKYPEDAQAIKLMMLTGLTAEKLGSLSWDNVDFKQNVIVVEKRSFKSKIGKRLVPMHTIVRDILFEIKNKDLSLAQLIVNYKSLDERFPQSLLSNTFAYFALKRNVRLTELYVLMGFDDILNVMRYFVWVPRKI